VKRSAFFLLGTVLLTFLNWTSLGSGAVSTEPERMRIAIVDFDTMGGDFGIKDLGSIVAEWLITSFVQSGRFEVVERSQLQKILEEQKLAVTGLVAQETAVKLGQVLGVKVLISGTLIKIGNAVEVNSRLIDTQDGSIIKAEKRRANRFADLERTVEELATLIKGDFPLVGYVVDVSSSGVMIDLGWKHGAAVDQTFIVYREGKKIAHPTTRQVLAVEEIPVGEIRLTKVDRITSCGVLTGQNEGQQVRSGDRVRTPVAAVSVGEVKKTLPSPLPAEPKPAEPKPASSPARAGQRPQLLLGWGGRGREPGKFDDPLSLFVDRGDLIYVADSGNNRVQVFDPNGRLIRTLGRKGKGEGEFSIPTDVAVDREGYIYVVDSRNRRVQKFDPQGNFRLQWGGAVKRGEEPLLSSPVGIAIDERGLIYISDAKLGRIQCFDSSGNPLSTVGQRGRAPSDLTRPTHLAIDSNGNLYVVDSATARINKYGPRGNYLTSFQHRGKGEQDFSAPQGIAVTADGYLYLVDREAGRLVILDTAGNPVLAIGEKRRGETPLNDPVDVALDREGNIYILERGAARIHKLSPFIP